MAQIRATRYTSTMNDKHSSSRWKKVYLGKGHVPDVGFLRIEGFCRDRGDFFCLDDDSQTLFFIADQHGFKFPLKKAKSLLDPFGVCVDTEKKEIFISFFDGGLKEATENLRMGINALWEYALQKPPSTPIEKPPSALDIFLQNQKRKEEMFADWPS